MKRNFGILMPVSCLPSAEGIGTLGEKSYRFIDYLKSCGASVWQVLPLNPTNYGDSPYQSCSSNALNYYFIDLDILVDEGLLKAEEVDKSLLYGDERRVDYGKQFEVKTELLKKAYSRFDGGEDFENFVKNGEFADFAVFMSLKSKFGHVAWTEWGEDFRNYDEAKTQAFVKENYYEVRFWHFTQYEFLKQWNALKLYANAAGVKIMGDIPLYIAYDSVEVWKYGAELFAMDEKRVPSGVAGCPPDGFTEDGQLWGNPVYDWSKMKENGYKWWIDRINGCFKLYDILRIDHFRGFDRYWEVPYGDINARGGVWKDGPKEEFFKTLSDKNIVAEDLGLIDGGVKRLMKNVGYPGMKILEFAFDGDPNNEHKPSNYTSNFVCYTGTHDNMPLRQYIDDLDESGLKTLKNDLAAECGMAGIAPDFESSGSTCLTVIRLAFRSKADTVIIPLSDLLAMGGEARMNLPSTVSQNNWSWRFTSGDFEGGSAEFLKNIAEDSGRTAIK